MSSVKPVLVVEDELDIRENMVMLLEDEGYLVYSASNGVEALEILRDPATTLPGLIALDFFMPVMDARAFLDAFEVDRKRRDRSYGGVTVILVTAADAQARTAIEGKNVAILKKPIDIDQFLNVVAQHCGKPAFSKD